MEYVMECEDGFSVHSKEKSEAISASAMHIMSMHPEMKISGNELAKKIRKM